MIRQINMTAVQKTVDISGSQMSVQELLHLVDEGIEILLGYYN